ncbi:FMN-binding protein [bacterium]|nr:FMN-binding protein [bacterium]
MRFSDVLICLLLLTGTAIGQSREDLTEYAVSAYGDDVQLERSGQELSSLETAALSKFNGGRHAWTKIAVWRVQQNGQTVGVMMVDNVKGKARPITYLVAFGMDGSIRMMEILTYRESHGGEVQSPLFLKQFEKKSHDDALTVGKDIRNISGATISSRALTRGAHACATYMHYLLKEKRL